MRDAGYTVTAIDGNSNAVAEAKQLGIEVIEGDFHRFEIDQKFDAVLFSASLHHMQPIDQAVNRAAGFLKHGGTLIVEEFAAELFDEKTAIWFYGLKSVIEAGAGAWKGRGPKLVNGQLPSDAVAAWREHHFGKHGVATSSELLTALNATFKISSEERLAYLYRYFTEDVSELQAQRIREWEAELCRAGVIEAIGLRVVGRKD